MSLLFYFISCSLFPSSAFEALGFNPKIVFKTFTLEEYLLYLTYTLEFRTLVIEQMSHVAEQKYLKAHSGSVSDKDGYGVMLLDFTIRDLKGLRTCSCFSCFIFVFRRSRSQSFWF
jgi:hypothetical protein